MTEQRDEQPQERGADPFSKAARARFNDSVESLDAATLSRLNQNRQRALEQAARSPLAMVSTRWLPATGAVAAAVVAVALWTGPQSVPELSSPSVASDLEIILEVDDFEMLENLEFYSWIDLDESGDGNVG